MAQKLTRYEVRASLGNGGGLVKVFSRQCLNDAKAFIEKTDYALEIVEYTKSNKGDRWYRTASKRLV